MCAKRRKWWYRQAKEYHYLFVLCWQSGENNLFVLFKTENLVMFSYVNFHFRGKYPSDFYTGYKPE